MLRLGVIGLSPGNGHPYSWSAIFNGYEPEAMEGCGFPVIPRYLEKESWPAAQIAQARVTHVWTQDAECAAHIASACRIGKVIADPFEMIGEVDGVLLARDDAETHLHFARPFLEAGLPVYIDKPMALSLAEAEQMFMLGARPGQLFTCSALRYAKELQLSDVDRDHIGVIRRIEATTPKSWNTYAVHIVEPVCMMLDRGDRIERNQLKCSGDVTRLSLYWASGIETVLNAMGDAPVPITFHLSGDRGELELQFKDTFSAFKQALLQFVRGIIDGCDQIERSDTLDVMRIIELGRKI